MRGLSVVGLSLSALLLVSCHRTEPRATVIDATQTQTLVDPPHLDKVLQGFIDQGKAVGVAALIMEDEREAYFGAFGMADREAGRPMTRDTVAQIYSMTKPLTGVVLMTLYDEAGRPVVDSPGPSLPALVHTYRVGCSASRSFSQPSMAASPSCTELMPKLMLMTTGMPHFSSKAAAYS